MIRLEDNETSLKDYSNIDSIDRLEILIDIEEEFDIDVPFNEIVELEEIVDYIYENKKLV